ncbi:tyrosine-type recombinase/integrase [Bartonella sp. LJL80]
MARPRPPYLQRQVDRHGNVVWYVRIRPNPRIRIYGEYGSPEFIKAYKAAVNGQELPTIRVASHSLEWLIEQYRKSSDWLSLSMATRRQRENIFLHVIKKAGAKPYKDITRRIIIASRDERADTPAQAGNFLKAMNGLFKWAIDAEYVTDNPCAGVKAPKLKSVEGFEAWNETDIDKYENKWPVGTKERVWLHVLLYTGLRRGDAVKIGRQHVRDGVATIKTEKSGYKTEVTLPILPVLQQTLDAGPTSDLAFICGANRQPLTKESFGNYFREACNEAGIKKSAHGVRKISATRAANAGATVAQLKALFGWEADNMAAHYTKSADRRRLAKEAIRKLEK